MQYIMVDVDLINNKNITNDEVIAYALLCDRMRSSKRSRSFFDPKFNDYYVIYTIEEMAKKLKVSVRKVNHIFKKLVGLGFLTKKKQFSRADKIFLPKFSDLTKEQNQTNKTHYLQHVHAESADNKTQNLQPNQSDLNQKNQSKIDTVNTRKTETVNKNSSAIKKWKHAVCNKVKLSELVVDRILKLTKNDLNRAHKIIGIILKAKNNIAKQNGLLNSPVSRFENNVNLGVNLATKLTHVFSYIPANLEEQCKYLMSSMKTFFLEAFGLKKDELIKTSVANGIQTDSEPVYECLKMENDEIPVPTEADKAKIREMLRHFE